MPTHQAAHKGGHKGGGEKAAPGISFMQGTYEYSEVMDTTALSLCMDNKMPIIVFDLTDEGNLLRLVEGDRTVGTLVS